jgi:uncharacterized MAPEG superfamily protein
MIYVALVTLLILIQYLIFMMQVGAARGKGKVQAPAVTGEEAYERASRVQMNTIEQMVVTLPAMWLVANFFRADVAAVLGVLFLIGRFIYSAAYRKDPASRGLGFLVGFIANIALILCGLYAVVIRLI